MVDYCALANSYQPPHNQTAMGCVGFLMMWIIGLFVIMLIFYLIRKQKPFLYGTIIAALLILGGIGLEIYLYEDQVYRMSEQEVEYTVGLGSNSNATEVVYLPVCTSKEFQNVIHVKSGSATIGLIETPNGTALQVNFTGSVSIYGHLRTTKDLGIVILTMKCSSSSWDRVHSDYWIYYSPANSTHHNCSYSLELRKWHAGNPWVTFSSSGHLTEGWNRYAVELDNPN